MNNYNWLVPRRRRQNLFIVEGSHEKNELMRLLLKVFPEINIDLDDILIYGTNIYMLYNDIVKTYQSDWYHVDVDLPYIVSQKNEDKIPLYKTDFVNIILIFDYERHDPNFSEEKIAQLQSYFQDATDVGKLYINYPMIESYQHLSVIPDSDCADRSVSVTLQPGKRYKNMVKDTMIAKMINLPEKMKEILMHKFHLPDQISCDSCVGKLLSINCKEQLEEQIAEHLSDFLAENDLATAKYLFADKIMSCNYLDLEETYFESMRMLFKQIIRHNICKASKIQGGIYEIGEVQLKERYRELDLREILMHQNDFSKSPISGMIWVLNTCVFFVPDYNFQLIN